MTFDFDKSRDLRLHFHASPAPAAQEALRAYTKLYGQTKNPAKADCLVALGGDGATLRVLRDGITHKKPVIGINYGHLCFLGNMRDESHDLIERIRNAEVVKLSPLRVEATLARGDIKTDFAINEVLICNQIRGECVDLKAAVDGKPRIDKLSGDGLIIATSTGSTAYNKSAGGPILPLGDDLLAFTPNNPFIPSSSANIRPAVIRPYPIEVNVINPDLHPVDVWVDSHKVARGVTNIKVTMDRGNPYSLLFDPGIGLEEKVMRTQFPPTPAPCG